MSEDGHFNIFEELQQWYPTLEKWEQLALSCHCKKGKIDGNDLEKIYNEFQYDKGLLDPPQDRTEHPLNVPSGAQSEQSKTLVLSAICKTKGINAIVGGQKLSFGPKLTVIYGNNASGKSAYARILKAASYTRSPSTAIHGNVNKSAMRPFSSSIKDLEIYIFSQGIISLLQ